MGKTGQHQLTQFKADLESAKDSFRKKLVLFTPSSTFSLLLLVFMLSLPPYFSASQSSLPFPLPLYYSKTSYGTKYSRNENCANQINNLEFSRRFQDKTHNEWDERESFVKKAGKYDMLAMDYKATVVSVRRRWEGANTPAPA